MPHPLLRLMPKQDRRLRSGYSWAFSNEIAMSPEHRTWSPVVARMHSRPEVIAGWCAQRFPQGRPVGNRHLGKATIRR